MPTLFNQPTPDTLKGATTPPGQAALIDPKPQQTTLPDVLIEFTDPGESTRTRRGVIANKQSLAAQRALAFEETRGMRASEEKYRLYREIQDCKAEEDLLEAHLQKGFVPQHHGEQLLSPRAFFVSRLFRVKSTAMKLAKHIELTLPTAAGRPTLQYEGPELSQSDGLVFMALVHMMRDVQVGTAVSLQPEAVCTVLFGGYDGHTRKLLREHIVRLQKGLITSQHFSVQLCLRFDFPAVGPWTVGLDTQLVKLFQVSPEVWLRLQPRLALPTGLASWLFAFIESQTRLIPMQLSSLRELCGSNATEKAFSNRMRDALRKLAATGIIELGWSLKKGKVHWMKARSQ